jgi:hypothetical protein
MTKTTIRIGQITIHGMSRMPTREAFGRKVQSAIAAALRDPVARPPQAATSLPVLRLSLHAQATDAEIARAVGDALRSVLGRKG